jgi:hypothetical protein
MFTILALIIGSWVVSGVPKSDPVIITSNSISLALLGVILFFKLRGRRRSLEGRRRAGKGSCLKGLISLGVASELEGRYGRRS